MMHDDLVDVYDAGSLIEATLLRDRLAEHDISAFLDNTDSPLGGLTAAQQTIPVRVLPEEEDRARRIVQSFVAEGG